MIYIALLRGINVGGSNKIKMGDLTRLFESLGYRNVRTYIQSGNVVFESGDETSDASTKLEKSIKEEFGFEVGVIIRESLEFGSILKNNPLLKKPGLDKEYLHVTLLRDLPQKEKILNFEISKDDNEKYEIGGREIFLYCPNGYGKSKLQNNTFEKKLGTKATTRNWKTMQKLLEMAKETK